MATAAYSLPMFRTNVEREAYLAEHGVEFLLVRGNFHRRERHSFPTIAAAEAYAAANPGSRPWMLYGVSACGSDVHLRNI